MLPTKKYQVFVSSTFTDLVDERRDAIRNILDLGHIPAGMEGFPAVGVDQLEYIKKVIDQCDYYLLIVGGRYGSMDAEGVSFTEREFDYAVEKGKFVVAFVHGNPSDITFGKSEASPKIRKALKNFIKNKATRGRMVKFWKDRGDLEKLVLTSLANAFRDYPQTGWVRADELGSGSLAKERDKLLEENHQLKARLKERSPTLKSVESIKQALSEVVSVDYYVRGTVQGKLDRVRHRSDFSYLDFYRVLAVLLDKPKPDRVVLDALKMLAEKSNSEHVPLKISDSSKYEIKKKLSELGLIELKVAANPNGAIVEFIELTEFGVEQFSKV